MTKRRNWPSYKRIRSSPLAGYSSEESIQSYRVYVHRTILSVRSPTFRHMLKDPEMNVIEIADIDTVAMEEVLKFVYTGAVAWDALPRLAEALLYASSKYKLLHLKNQCEGALSEGLSAENIYRRLLIADVNEAMTLKKNITMYIQKVSRHDIFQTNDFNEFKEQHPKLANELLLSIFNSVAIQP